MRRLLTTICFSLLTMTGFCGGDFYGYTEENPLTIVCDWDFRPLEFLDSNGDPAGYNVEVLSMILDRLEIPYQFIMQDWHEATQLFETRQADLIHALSFIYKRRPYIITKKYVNYYNVRTARRLDTPPLHSIASLDASDTLYMKRDDYASVRIKEVADSDFTIRYCSPKDGLMGVRKGLFPYYIWGEVPLTRKIQELHLDSLVLDEIDIPAGELRIIGYDADIIDLIDDQYTRLEEAGELRRIYDKWFHPEIAHDDASPVTLFIIGGLLLVGIVAFLLTRLTAARVKVAVRRSEELLAELQQHDRQLQATNDAIRHYEQQLTHLLEESDMYIWTLDTKTRQINLSRNLQKAEFTFSLEVYYNNLCDDCRENASYGMEQAISRGETYNGIHHLQRAFTEPGECWQVVAGMPQRDENGRMTGYYGIIRKITTLIQAQQQLKQETARANDSGRLKAAFLANMTHEIRTPLNAIVGFSSLLKMVDEDAERTEFIRIIRNNCDMLLRLINDILEASSMGQSLSIEPSLIDLPQVFDDICQTLAQRVQEPDVEFQKDNPYVACLAYIDKGRLQQLLTNFVTNAVKYTHHGHIRVGYRKETRQRAADDGTMQPVSGFYFYCEDTGTGIPKEKQPDVFKRFVKLNDFVQGTGLGLSISKSIIDRCHGEIGVEGDVGIGSTFWFWVPITEEA